jgi:PAS domain-containing protein
MAVSVHDGMLAVVQSLYDAAMDESLWPSALRHLTDFTGSQAATFWTLDSAPLPRLPILTTFNFDPAFMKEYLESMVPQDPTVQYLVEHPDEPIVHDGLVITEHDKDRHAYYAWHGRNSDTRFRLVGQSRPAPEVQAGVALHRTRRAGRYEPADIERFAFLYGHLRRALAIAFRLGALDALHQSTADLLDHNRAAILLLDPQRRIVYANRTAEKLLSSGEGIRLWAKRIDLSSKQDNARLEALIATTLSQETTSAGRGGILRVSRRSGKRPWSILVAPVSRRHPGISPVNPCVYVVITDPESRDLLPERYLQDAFGLTAAEAKLAAFLGTGQDLRSAAARLEITYGTARARLAVVFQKTQTTRQAELVALLLTTVADR